jgi:hypothetical protein
MGTLTDELRRRLDVPVDLVPDTLLDAALAVAADSVGMWLDPDPVVQQRYQANIDEATVQLAVKVWDTSVRGVSGMDAAGEWQMPSPAATPGLVRSVFGVLGPAMASGGVSV